jgi:O-acetylhomoserine (thiol)-lyase
MTICSAGDHIVASSRMYGANINLLENTLPRFGITTTFVAPDDLAAIEAAIQPNTKIVFGEVIGNPGLDVMDVEAVAKITAKASVPLMLDCTFNTPWLLKPIELGANIIIHSLTKWMGGHGIAIGGAVVDGGNFNWDQNDKFPTIAGPHYAMNEINFFEEFGPAAFTAKFRAEGMYNFGPSMSPTNAFHILQGLETLPLRMQKHMDNTAELLAFLNGHDAVAWVRHPMLADHPSHELVKKMLPRGAGSIIVFGLKGGRDAGKAFIEAVDLASHLANVGDAKTLVIHPASTTHSHISAEAMLEGGLSDDMIRLSVGLEDVSDIIADFEQGFKAAARKIKS